MNENFEAVIERYLHRIKVEGRIPAEDKIHQEVQIAFARILGNK